MVANAQEYDYFLHRASLVDRPLSQTSPIQTLSVYNSLFLIRLSVEYKISVGRTILL